MKCLHKLKRCNSLPASAVKLGIASHCSKQPTTPVLRLQAEEGTNPGKAFHADSVADRARHMRPLVVCQRSCRATSTSFQATGCSSAPGKVSNPSLGCTMKPETYGLTSPVSFTGPFVQGFRIFCERDKPYPYRSHLLCCRLRPIFGPDSCTDLDQTSAIGTKLSQAHTSPGSAVSVCSLQLGFCQVYLVKHSQA